ncbi:MAG: lysophospholipid acyltransferase family protein [Kiritimatiellales bacterium]|nr:lysophospholipid acyltransferase family protein [Kiritimatiellota bacterium]MBL7011603.1 lysophospholipid acyltransferase family protein [Kiritimatiellales bacterium]
MNPLREKTEYILTRGFFAVLRCCPAPVIYGACRGFAFLFYLLGIKRRDITLKNLRLAYPELSAKERRRIARKAYDHFGQLIAESAMVLSGKITREGLQDLVDSSELHKLQALEESTEKGLLIITGHLGNFELLAHYTGCQMKKPGTVIFRRGSNRLIDDRIVTPLRQSFGNKVIYKSRALPQIVRTLKKGNHVGMLIDIKTNSREGVPAVFFGNQTLAIKSSAYLQIKLGVPVVALSMVRIAPKKYKLVVLDPIHWEDDGRSINEQVADLTQRHHAEIETLIRQYPEQWLWMHDRWKR